MKALLGVSLFLFVTTGCASKPDVAAADADAERGVCSAQHEHWEHTHGPKCGHQAVKHDEHWDYKHENHLDCPHFGHYDIRPAS